MSVQVKPCPFCGEHVAVAPRRCGSHYVTCDICFTQGPRGFSQHVATEGWNSRFISEEDAEAEREACIRILEDMRPRNDLSDWTEFTVTTDTVLRLAIEAINARYPS